MKNEEGQIINKTSDIHIRCYPEDKDFVIDRSKDGFGKETNSITNLVLYAIRHMDDSSPIVLSHVDDLIKTISFSRQALAAVHEDISGVPRELSAIGNNINQIAKAINTIMRVADVKGEDYRETANKVIVFQGEVRKDISELSSIMESYEQKIHNARVRVNSCLRKEDELLTKTLAHPRVGKKQMLEAQLVRLLEEYMQTDNIRIGKMNVVDLLFELRSRVKASVTAETDAEDPTIRTNKERR